MSVIFVDTWAWYALVTEYLGDVSLALPFSGSMTEEQVDYVCDHLRQLVQTNVTSIAA